MQRLIRKLCSERRKPRNLGRLWTLFVGLKSDGVAWLAGHSGVDALFAIVVAVFRWIRPRSDEDGFYLPFLNILPTQASWGLDNELLIRYAVLSYTYLDPNQYHSFLCFVLCGIAWEVY